MKGKRALHINSHIYKLLYIQRATINEAFRNCRCFEIYCIRVRSDKSSDTYITFST